VIVDPMSYELISTNFQKRSLLLSVAELHGMMLGYLSTNPDPCFKTWTLLIDDLLLWDDLDDITQDQLARLFLSGNIELVQHVLDLTLALPDENQSFLTRLTAMADWCRGYLYGVGLANPPACLFEDDEIQELLNDITQFSQVEIDVEVVPESQQALHEILHHIQMTVQTIYTRCRKEAMSETV